jgi:hypothetical protein
MDVHEQKMVRAEQANQVLNNPLFEQAFTETRLAVMNAWAALSPNDERRSEYSADLHRMLRALDHVKVCLVEHITTGKLAEHQIKAKRNMFGRVK